MFNDTTTNLHVTGTNTLGLTLSNSGLTTALTPNITYLQPASLSNYILNPTPQNTMTQTKVAVFKVERHSEKGTVIKSTFMEEIWVERISGVSLELLAAKDIKEFDPLTMVIKEIYSVSL